MTAAGTRTAEMFAEEIENGTLTLTKLAYGVGDEFKR